MPPKPEQAPPYAEQLAIFMRAILSEDTADMLAQIKPARHNEILPKERLSVYRNGYFIRLHDALTVDYPCFCEYIGNEEANRLIRDFVHQNPSSHWDLNLYSIAFANWLKDQENIPPEALDLARIESAITYTFWGTQSPPKSHFNWQELSLETLASMRFTRNPASVLLALHYNSNAYLQAWREDADLPEMRPHANYLCVIRKDYKIHRIPISLEAYSLLQAISDAENFEAALMQTAEHDAIQPEALIAELPNVMQSLFEHEMLLPPE